MEEQVFYDKSGIMVTKTRFIVHGQTFSMANISSVRLGVTHPNTTPQFLLIATGVIVSMFALSGDPVKFGALIIGLGLAALGVYSYRTAKPTYNVTLTSTSVEKSLLRDKGRFYLEEVIEAINNAIISRG